MPSTSAGKIVIVASNLPMARKPQRSPTAFGPRLAALRKAAGYTQVEFAKATGISQRMVSYYETTADHPIVTVLREFAQTLGVSADELLGIAPSRSKSARRERGAKRTG